MDIDDFSRRVLEILQREFPDRGFRRGEDSGTLIAGDLRMGLTNLLAEFENTDSSWEKLEQTVVGQFRRVFEMMDGGMASIPDDYEEAKDRLRPQLVSSRLDAVDRAVSFPFADDVVWSIVVDAPGGYAYVRPQDVERWGVTTVDLIEVARANLLNDSAQLELLVVPGPPKFVAIQTGDGYDAARILVPAIRKAVIEELAGEDDGPEFQLSDDDASDSTINVGIPNRDFLIAWSTRIEDDLDEQLADRVREDARRQPHPLSEHVFRITGEKIVPR